jgi:nucleoid-associated protein YgaU
MSVMSAAEARQAAGTSPEIPSQPLRIVRPVTGQDGPSEAEELLDPGDETSAGPGVTGRGASTVRVTQVRMVRQVRVSTLRAEAARSRIVPEQRAAAPTAATTLRAGAASQFQAVSQSQAASQFQAASQSRTAVQSQAASQSRTAVRSRVTRQAWVTRQAHVASPARVASRPGPVRLTRRGRLVVAGLVICVVIVAVTVLWTSLAGGVQASSHGPSAGSPYQGMTQVVVRPGQTLWSIAAAAEPSGNSWAVVQQIINVNALSGASVQAGQLLWVPRN